MAKKGDRNYNTPAEQVEGAAAKAGAAQLERGETKLDLSDLLGTWQACNRETRSVVRVDIGQKDGSPTVRVFGSCSPTPCDWGTVEGIAYSTSVSDTEAIAITADYEFSFKDTVVTGLLDNGTLILETYNRFKDGSGRSNYYSRGYFCRRSRKIEG